MTNNQVSLHRVLKASPEKVFRAFTDPKAFAAWLPPYGFLATIDLMNVEEGGSFHMSFHNFSTGNGHSFGGKYLSIKPNEFLQYTTKFDNPGMPDEMTNTIQLQQVICGTDIKILQENIPAFIPAEMCYLGWQESLEKLAKLVEPVIPDA